MSIEKRGDKWLARVSRMVDGKQKQPSKLFRLKRDAERWEQEQRDKITRGLWIEPSRESLNAFLDRWLAGPMETRRRTRDDYARILRTYIRPILGDARLDQLSTDAVRTALAALTAEGYAPGTVRAAHRVLRLALNAAVEDGKLVKNPAVAKRMVPSAGLREQRVLNRAEIHRLLDRTQDEPLGPLWNFLALTGARPGEALGLKWGDVDFERREVSIQRALVPQTRDAEGRTWRLEPPKTKRSRRAIPLVAETVAALRMHRDRQMVERLVAADQYATHHFVFCDAQGQPLREDSLYKGPFRRALKAAGVPLVTLYALRHGYATLMMEIGRNLKEVGDLLGHSSVVMTGDVYSHVSAGLKRQATDELGRHVYRPERAVSWGV